MEFEIEFGLDPEYDCDRVCDFERDPDLDFVLESDKLDVVEKLEDVLMDKLFDALLESLCEPETVRDMLPEDVSLGLSVLVEDKE